MSYKFLEHTADLKVLVKENKIEDAFCSSALALKEAMASKIKIKSRVNKEIIVKGKDYERLLYEFLEQFLYMLDAEDFLLSKIETLNIKKKKDAFELKSSISGDRAGNYKFTNDVKAITYNDMEILELKKSTTIQFVLDV